MTSSPDLHEPDGEPRDEPRPAPRLRDLSARTWLGFLISTLLLTASFNNAFGVAEDRWFEHHHDYTQGQVLARMAIADEEGLFAYGGLTGRLEAKGFQKSQQREIYESRAPITSYEPYLSQVGLQATLYALFELATDLPRPQKVELLLLANALLTALAVSILITWLGVEFGPLAFALALATTIFSPWMTIFGRSLYWVMWTFYLPFAAVVWVTAREKARAPASLARIAVVCGVAVLFKCLMVGYEYMTTALLMMVTPIVYAAIADQWSLRRLAQVGGVVSGAAVAGVVVSMGVLCVQVAVLEGDPMAGIDHILLSAERRTHANPKDHRFMYRGSLRASTTEVVSKYFTGTALGHGRSFDGLRPQDLERTGRITYGDLTMLAAIVSLVASLLAGVSAREGRVSEARNMIGLVAMTWFALLAPLSWFVIFKSHSHIHTHVNFITWHLPFVPIVFALCGFVLAQLFGEIRSRALG